MEEKSVELDFEENGMTSHFHLQCMLSVIQSHGPVTDFLP